MIKADFTFNYMDKESEHATLQFSGDQEVINHLTELVSTVTYDNVEINNAINFWRSKKISELEKIISEMEAEIEKIKLTNKPLLFHREAFEQVKLQRDEIKILKQEKKCCENERCWSEKTKTYSVSQLVTKYQSLLTQLGFEIESANWGRGNDNKISYESTCSDEELMQRTIVMNKEHQERIQTEIQYINDLYAFEPQIESQGM